MVNESDAKGGTLKMGLGGAWGDSFDPGDTYYGYSWDLGRTYYRTLVMYKSAPGKAGLELVPDIATDLGKASDGGKTWTYTIQSGPEVRGRHAVHQQGHRLRGLPHLRPRRAQAGPELLRAAAELAEGLQGSVQGSQGRGHLLGHRDA